MTKLRSFLVNEYGNVLVTVSIMMVVLLGFTALTVDVGRLYAEKSSLQKALDAAVLGGAQVLLTDDGGETVATSTAQTIASQNSFSLTEEDIDSNPVDGYVKATKEVSIPMTFARVLGFNNTKVYATAKAEVAPLEAGIGITPIAVEKDAINETEEVELTCIDNPGNDRGNCGYLAIDESRGGSDLETNIINGVELSVEDDLFVDSEEDTEPGGKVGKVRSAVTTLLQEDVDNNRDDCTDFETANSTCSNVIYVVIVKTFDDAAGRSEPVEIVGLAAYWISGMQGNSIVGQFIEMVTPGEIDDNLDDYGLYGVKLVE